MTLERLIPENIEKTLYFEFDRGTIKLVGAPFDEPPFEVEAEVIEEDTYLVLSPPSEKIKRPKESIGQLLSESFESYPLERGMIVVKKAEPLQFLAVIHDFEEDPTWNEDAVVRAITGIFTESDRHRFVTLSMPFLGTVHGTMSRQHSFMLLQQTLLSHAPTHLEKIWLKTTMNEPLGHYELID